MMRAAVVLALIGALTSPARAGNDEGIPRIDFYGAAVGLRFDHPHALAAGEPAKDVVFSTTIGLRYGYGIGDFGGIRFAGAPNGDTPDQSRPVDATVHELAVHLGSSVYF
jgi:hypothetical protein